MAVLLIAAAACTKEQDYFCYLEYMNGTEHMIELSVRIIRPESEPDYLYSLSLAPGQDTGLIRLPGHDSPDFPILEMTVVFDGTYRIRHKTGETYTYANLAEAEHYGLREYMDRYSIIRSYSFTEADYEAAKAVPQEQHEDSLL